MNGNAVVANSTLEAIADAIREKTGETGTIKPYEMPERILGISGDSDVIQIEDEADLWRLLDEVNSGDNKAGKTYVLTTDIDFSGTEWPGIGRVNDNYASDQNVSFSGIFDGAGHTISGFKFAVNPTDYSQNANTYRGFFNSVDRGIVRNLRLDCLGFADSVTQLSKAGGAVCVGWMAESTIEDVTCSGLLMPNGVSAKHNAAGICCCFGKRVNTVAGIRRCTSNVELRSDYTKCGGIVAYSVAVDNQGVSYYYDVPIEDCVNSGNITSIRASHIDDGGIGGIVGWSGLYGTVTLRNCSNTGSVVYESVNAGCTGALVGYIATTTRFHGTNSGNAGFPLIGNKADTSEVGALVSTSCEHAVEFDGLWYAVRKYKVGTSHYLKPGFVYVPYRADSPNVVLKAGEVVGFSLAYVTDVTPNVTADGEGVMVTAKTVGDTLLYYAENGDTPVA